MTEDKLNKTISDIAYILDSLILLRQIQNTGDCNECKNKDCKCKPKIGQMVRYNCPFYKDEDEGMTREELDFIGSMNMCDEISNEAYKKIVCHCEEQEPCEDAVNRVDALKALECDIEPLKFKKNIGKYMNDIAEFLNIIFVTQSNAIKALPSVTPKKNPNVSMTEAYNDGQAYILDKIRAEIEDIPNNPATKPVGTYDYCVGARNERRIILEIIDKYRKVSE